MEEISGVGKGTSSNTRDINKKKKKKEMWKKVIPNREDVIRRHCAWGISRSKTAWTFMKLETVQSSGIQQEIIRAPVSLVAGEIDASSRDVRDGV